MAGRSLVAEALIQPRDRYRSVTFCAGLQDPQRQASFQLCRPVQGPLWSGYAQMWVGSHFALVNRWELHVVTSWNAPFGVQLWRVSVQLVGGQVFKVLGPG